MSETPNTLNRVRYFVSGSYPTSEWSDFAVVRKNKKDISSFQCCLNSLKKALNKEIELKIKEKNQDQDEIIVKGIRSALKKWDKDKNTASLFETIKMSIETIDSAPKTNEGKDTKFSFSIAYKNIIETIEKFNQNTQPTADDILEAANNIYQASGEYLKSSKGVRKFLGMEFFNKRRTKVMANVRDFAADYYNYYALNIKYPYRNLKW